MKTLIDPYRAAHDRVRAARGKATEHRCVECGGQAQEWALIPDPVAEPQVARHDGKAMWFSTLTSDYQAMCVTCHRRMDALSAAQRDDEFAGVWS